MRLTIWIAIFAVFACGKIVKQRGIDTVAAHGEDAERQTDFSRLEGDDAKAEDLKKGKDDDAKAEDLKKGQNNDGEVDGKIQEVSEAPVTKDITTNVDRNAKVSVNIDLASVTTAPGDEAVTYKLVTTASHGTVTLDPKTGLVKYLPNHNFLGTDTLTFSASNSVGTSNISSIIVNVITILSKVKATLAVRGMGCLMCHANIKSNIVTDFGFPDEVLYLGGHGSDFTGSSRSWYNNNQNSWQTSENIHGQLFIPDAALPKDMTLLGEPLANYPTLSSSPIPTLLDLLNFTYINETDRGEYYLKHDVTGKPYATPHTNRSIASFVKPPNVAAAPIVPNKVVTIRAPAASEILALAPEMDANTVAFKAVPLAEIPSAKPLSGLGVKTGSGSFVTNNGATPIVCYGDVVIVGPLLLKSASIDTDQFGCRLYVTGTVFIEGPITFTDLTVSSHLQIASSRAILMGIGSSPLRYPEPAAPGVPKNPLEMRLNSACVGCNGLVNAPLRGGATITNDFFPLIMKDADAVISVNGPLLDSTDAGSSAYDPASFADPKNRRPQAAVPYRRLLLNAPIVESRYLGNFSGTIIAEVVLFPVGRFDFSYDTSFDNPKIPFLPLLDQPPLFVQ